MGSLECEAYEIDEEAIGSEEDQCSDKGIEKNCLCFLCALFIPCRSDIVEGSKYEEKYHHGSSKVYRESE